MGSASMDIDLPTTIRGDDRVYTLRHQLSKSDLMGTAYKAFCEEDQQWYVVKMFRKDTVRVHQGKTSQGDRYLREVGILARAHHPHLLSLTASFETVLPTSALSSEEVITNPFTDDSPDPSRLRYCHVTKFMDGGTLYHWLRQGRLSDDSTDAQRKLRLQVVTMYCRQIADGLCHLHSQNIVHMDLKLDNIFLTADHKNVVVGDFGLSRIFEPDSSVVPTVLCTRYCPPEALQRLGNKRVYEECSESWQFALILCELVLGKVIRAGMPICEVEEDLRNLLDEVNETCVGNASFLFDIAIGVLKYRNPEDRNRRLSMIRIRDRIEEGLQQLRELEKHNDSVIYPPDAARRSGVGSSEGGPITLSDTNRSDLQKALKNFTVMPWG